MSRVNVIRIKDGRYVELEADEVAEEITAIAYANPTTTAWTVVFSWKNKGDDTFTIPANTVTEQTIGIPPGQRKWLEPVEGIGNGGWQSEISRVTG